MTKLKSILSYTPQFSKRIENFILYAPFVLAAMMFAGCIVYELIQPPLTQETRNTIYSIGGNTVYCLSMFLCFLYGRKYGIGLLRSAVYTYLCFGLVFTNASVLWRNLDIKVLGFGSVASFRSLLIFPILCFFLSRFDKHTTLTLCDYLTPYYLFMHGITTHHCWISGCCAGKTMKWGIINSQTLKYTFPAQPYVIFLALGVSFWSLKYASESSYKTNGAVFSFSLIEYGFFRFILEFFTDDPRIWGPFSLYSIYSLILILMGGAIRYYTKRRTIPSLEINQYTTIQKNVEEQS